MSACLTDDKRDITLISTIMPIFHQYVLYDVSPLAIVNSLSLTQHCAVPVSANMLSSTRKLT